jgi:DNA mismatch repair protein MutS
MFYDLDVLISLAKLAQEKDFCLPNYITTEENIKVEITGLFHLAHKNPVATTIAINNRNHVTFLSGSNMSGKSAFLKSVGIAIYLVQFPQKRWQPLFSMG